MQLVIAEKPSVAASIAKVIGANSRKDGFMEGNGYIVTWCFGHLIEKARPEEYDPRYKKWSYDHLPIIPEKWKHKVIQNSKQQYQNIEKLMNDKRVESIICATDAGREGELIFRLVYNQAKCSKPIKRLWISSLEDSAIQKGFQNLRPGSEYDRLYYAAECRAEADWLVGMNWTELFTVQYGNGKLLNVGRVKSPTLAILVEREAEIQDFVKEPFYVVHIQMDNNVEASSGHYKNRSEAEKIASGCWNSQACVKTLKKEKKVVPPPHPYDLTTLQRDANRLFGITAKDTLDFTQSLYEKKLCTYPRTDSQYLTEDMWDTAEQVFQAIQRSFGFAGCTVDAPDYSRLMNNKKVTDHHAIIPTVGIVNTDIYSLKPGERTVLALIAGRFLCAVGSKHEYESVKAEFECNGTPFTANGKTILASGWKETEERFLKAYGVTKKEDDKKEKRLPDLTEGEKRMVVNAKVTDQMTSPPRRYTEDSLLSAMERAGTDGIVEEVERIGIGTTATRADIIETLIKDGFVKREKKNLVPTPDGIKLCSILPEAAKSPRLTADWENKLALVAQGKMAPEEFMDGIISMVKQVIIGNGTAVPNDKAFKRNENMLGNCPNCGGKIIKGKYGPYCSQKCGFTIGKIRGKTLTDDNIKDLLAGKKILLKGLVSQNNGKTYDAYFIPNGVKGYSFHGKDGIEHNGTQFDFEVTFPKRK